MVARVIRNPSSQATTSAVRAMRNSHHHSPRSGATEDDYRPGFMELLPAETDERDGQKQLRVGITLLPRFTLLAFSGFVDALRIASDIGDRSRPDRCAWTLVGADPNPVRSSCGATIAHWEKFGDPSRFDYVVVVGGLLGELQSYDAGITDFLRRAADCGATIVGLCTGVFAMAAAGIMDGYRCCVHGYHLLDFEQRFPRIAAVSDQIFVVDRQRITCAGGAASIDVAGYILEQCCGRERAHKILPHLVIDELRPADHPQLLFLDNFFSVHDERVRSAVFLMQQHLANPISVTQIAEKVGAPARQLQRGFQRFFTASPSSFFRKMRLGRARWLVLHSELTITKIAIDCGFADTAHLTRSFKREYGELPTSLRKRVVLQNRRNSAEHDRLSPAFKIAECVF